MVIKRDFIYTPKGKGRMLHIWLPDRYNETDERYPVMYFFDGHNLYFDEDATFGKSWGLKEFLEHWPKDIIVVGIECGHEGEERLSEYSPYRTKTGFLSKYEAMGDVTLKWIVNEIKPMIDSEYRTIPERECTGIAGSSMGGLMSVYAITMYNTVFSKAACVSSSIVFCRNQLLHDMNRNEMSPDTRVFLSWGTCEARGVLNPETEDTVSLKIPSATHISATRQWRTAFRRREQLRCCTVRWEEITVRRTGRSRFPFSWIFSGENDS